MPVPPIPPGLRHLQRPLLLAAALCLPLGCKKAEIQSYVVPKETPEEDTGKTAPENPELSQSLPKLAWKLPAGWTENGPDKMSVATFSIPGKVFLMVTPLPSMAGQEASIVNLWRQQLSQPLLNEADVAAALTDVSIAGGSGKLFEITGTDGKQPYSILTAFQHRENRTWFFKVNGPPDAVSAARPAMLEFLKSLSFDASTAAPAPPAPSSPGPAPTPAPEAAAPAVPGTPPAAWKAQAHGEMQAAKFSVPEKDGATAEVAVSVFSSDTGGTVANVKRWRGQLSLPELDDAAVAALAKPIEGGPAGAVYVELENQGRSLIGAIVPRGGAWYFYKLTGGSAAVAAAREDFISYCKAGA